MSASRRNATRAQKMARPLAMVIALCLACAASNDSAAAVWVADGSNISEIDVASGNILETIPNASVTRLAATRDGRVWVLGRDRLQLLGPGGASSAQLDLASLGYTAATLLAVNPYDDSVWVATDNQSLLHIDQNAVPLATYALPDQPRAAALDTDESLWVVGNQFLWHISQGGQVIARLQIPQLASGSPTSLNPDSLGGKVWLASERGLIAVDTSVVTNPRVALEIPLPNTRSAAMDARSGVLWVLTDSNLNAYNRNGRSMASIGLGALGAPDANSLAFDAEQEVIILGGPFGSVGLTSTGGSLFTARTNRVENLSASPWVLTPLLTIKNPAAGAVSDDRRPEIVIELNALCSGAPCQLDPQYFSRYHVSATLNGQAIDQALRFDAASGQMKYRPPTALPTGRNVLSAHAVDPFGHRSEVTEIYWSIGERPQTEDSTSTLTGSTETQSTSSAVTLAAAGKNKAPTATLTAPQTGATFSAGATITLTATASDADGTVTRVDFLRGTTVIGTDTSAPYSINWSSVPAGSYSLTAKAVDNAGATGTSAAVNISVVSNQAPIVSLTAPANQSVVTAGSTVQIAATASDPDGTVANVQLFDGATLLATLTASPFQFIWANISAGAHSLYAKATDNQGAVTTSVTHTITAVAPPMVVITSPVSCSRFDAPYNLVLSADAESAAGSIAKVEFFQGTTLVGTSTVRPFNVAIGALAQGDYTFSAKATDAAGLFTTSRPINLAVGPANVLPTVSLTSPANGAAFGPSPNITCSATANDSDGTISAVTFYANGAQVIGTATSAPYSVVWTGAPAGNHVITAIATDNRGGTASSAAVNVSVAANSPPSVTLTAPAAGTNYYSPARFDLSASATDSDGTIARVEFFVGGSSVGVSTAPPYAVTAMGIGAGTYSVTARATDNLGGQTTSSPVSITVLPNAAPTVALTEPAASAAFFAPATLRLSATASDSDGSIQRVEFYAGSTLVGTATNSPYSVVWDAVPAGSYSVAALAVDDRGGAAISSPVVVTVAGSASLTILEPVVNPADNLATGNGSVYVRGQINAPPNSAVIVNGIAAIVDDYGQFHVNNVPLTGATTTLTATVVTQDGIESSQTINVADAGAPAFTVEPDAGWGIGSKEVAFTLTDLGVAPIVRYEFDFNGDGTSDFTAQPSAFQNGRLVLALNYPQPANYLGTVTGYDANNLPIFAVKHAIVVKAPVPLGSVVKGVFAQMKDRLSVSNVEGALTAFTATSREKYRQIFNAVLGVGTPLTFGSVAGGRLSEDFAEFIVIQDEAGTSVSHLIYMTRGNDGIWRFDSF